MEHTRELVLRMAEAETDAVNAMNTIMQTHSLPCFLFEAIIEKIHRQLIDGKSSEVLAARARENSKPEQ